ncbi:MAG: pseudouridine synthase [Acidobacteriota bacterium]
MPPKAPSSFSTSRFPQGKDRVTLDRAFSKAGMCSRTDALRKIQSGQVSVNGRVVRDPEMWVSQTRDVIRHEGRALQGATKVYLMLYKPRGVVTTHRDPDGRRTVYDLLTDLEAWVSPVGRLDKDTSGMLLLTNDTQFSEGLTNPVNKVPKTYQLKVSFNPTEEQLEMLRKGIFLKNGERTLPSKVRKLRCSERHAHLELEIVEGRNRQVRRMIEAIGGKVLKLVRTRIATLTLGNLQVGRYRPLNGREVRELKALFKIGRLTTGGDSA